MDAMVGRDWIMGVIGRKPGVAAIRAPVHPLLARQIRQASAGGVVDVDKLCRLVSASYGHADTERRQTERAAQTLRSDLDAAAQALHAESEARFAVAMDNVGEAVLIVDDNGRIERINKAAETMFAITASEAPGLPVRDFLGEEMECEGEHCNVGGVTREIVARRWGGGAFDAELTVGEVTGTGRCSRIGIVRDVTQRKQIEQELRDSESRFRDLAGSASDWFWETDADYKLTFVSERIAAVLGVKPAAILGHSFFDIGLGDDNPAQAAEHAADLAEHQPFRDVVFHVGPEDGKDSKIIRISGIPVHADGCFVGYRGVGADITREVMAEKRARQARQHLADAIESLVDAIAVYDADDRLVVFNRQYSRAFGITDDTIRAGLRFEEVLRIGLDGGIIRAEGGDPVTWFARRMALHRAASGEPFLVAMADGRWFLSREYRTRDGGTVGVRTDITEIKRREAELEVLRHRYELILGAAGEGIIGLNALGRITFANQTAAILLGHAPDDMVGCSFHALVRPVTVEVAGGVDAVRRAYVQGVAQQVRDDLFRRFDGSCFHVEYQVTPMREQGELAGAVLVFRDATLRLRYEEGLADQQRELERLVSERTTELRRENEIRKRTEAALRGSRERLKGIADSLFEGVLVVNRFGQLMFANASARRLLGCEAFTDDLEGHALDELMGLRQRGEVVGFADSPWRRVIADGEVVRDDDSLFVAHDGRQLSVAYACSPIREDGALRGAIISFRDIESLKQAQREALAASRLASVGQLAAGIAHEINTPVQYIGDNLRFIGGSLDKLSQAVEVAGDAERFAQVSARVKLGYLLRELPSAIEESLDGVGQIARIVLSMKEFSHPGTTAQSATDINRAIDSTLTVSRNTWKHVAEVERDLSADLPPVICHAGEMNQVFLNLIVNAADAIESSGRPLPGIIRVSTRDLGGWVEIQVADSGTGIAPDIAERIFDPFFTTKKVGKGTGQGLAICRDVVMVKHGGQIEAGISDLGGAVFTIRLPVDGLAVSAEGGLS